MKRAIALRAAIALAAVSAVARAGAGDALEAWRALHGPSWQAWTDEGNDRVRFLFGGIAGAPAAAAPTPEDFAAIARRFVDESFPLHGIEGSTLGLERVLQLPLARIGTSDKVTVEFRQELAGVRVHRGAVDVLLDAGGRLLSIDAQALPALAGFDVRPTRLASEAVELARAWFEADGGRGPSEVSSAELRILQQWQGPARAPALVWVVEASGETVDGTPLGYRYFASATGPAARLEREALVHRDVKGTVKALATPGVLPDVAYNPPVAHPMAHMTVVFSGPGASATTDANGNFTIPSVSSTSATFGFSGPFAKVDNFAGPELSTTLFLSGTGNQIVLNQPASPQYTAMANAFRHVNLVRDWVRSIDPFDATADFQALASVNWSSDCNAYYTGAMIKFYLPYSSCTNTAMSTVVAHEYGHWLNDKYSSFNGPDGFGEGNADVFAMYANDTPTIALDVDGPGLVWRTGWNTTQFCGDSYPACHGEEHADGEVLMGALWKVRNHLDIQYGDALGDAIADALFSAWMNAYNDSQIKSVIETHWLVLDDDDGNLADGTPHFPAIDSGFRDQGFPGYPPNPSASVWIDVNWTGGETGTQSTPYDTLQEGVFMVLTGGLVTAKPGTYAEHPTLVKPMTIQAFAGVATIGN